VRLWIRYAALATAVTGALLGLAWLFSGEEARRGLLVAGAIALPMQLLVFAGLLTQESGTPGFLAAWGASTLLRFAVVGGAAFWIAGMEGVDLVVALLALVGLLFVLLLLEPWVLRHRT
jgi:hypothetical protein